MRELSDLEKVEQDRNMVVVCCGSSITEYASQIRKFIEDRNAVVIGMNKMTNFITPKYHLWTNKKRWKHYGHICKEESIKLIDWFNDYEGRLLTFSPFRFFPRTSFLYVKAALTPEEAHLRRSVTKFENES